MAACMERLKFYLHENHVSFEIQHHPEAFTAQDVAATLHEAGGHVAKVVMAWVDGRIVMLVLPAPEHVDFERVEHLLHVQYARAAREEEFKHLFKDCDVGAMPPFGHMYGVPVYVDQSLTLPEHLVFQAGSHRDTIKIATSDYLRLATPTVVTFSLHAHAAA
ncbi:MAG: YbaK/EbsC family protein [Anaerolineales bacterium]|nr:YbaK/EbsC family protein [Anaerolineales bacterium]